MNLGTLPLLVSLLTAQAQPAKPAAAASPPASAQPAVPSTVAGVAPLPGQPNLLVSGVPEVPPELKARLHQYLESRSAQLLDVSDDGKQALISTRFAEVNQLHMVEQPMGARTQLTFTPEPILQARLLPGSTSTVFYLQDVGGGEFHQVFRLDRSTGRSELLTDGKSRHEALRISHDGKWLAYANTSRNGADTDVYVAPTDNPRQARRITEAKGTWHPVDTTASGARRVNGETWSVA